MLWRASQACPPTSTSRRGPQASTTRTSTPSEARISSAPGPGGPHGGHAVMYTCSTAACRSVGETVKSDLRAIGITVAVKQFPYALMFEHETRVRMTRHGQLVADFPPARVTTSALSDGSPTTPTRRSSSIRRSRGSRSTSRHRRPALPTAHRRRRQTRRGAAPARLRHLDIDLARRVAPSSRSPPSPRTTSSPHESAARPTSRSTAWT